MPWYVFLSDEIKLIIIIIIYIIVIIIIIIVIINARTFSSVELFI